MKVLTLIKSLKGAQKKSGLSSFVLVISQLLWIGSANHLFPSYKICLELKWVDTRVLMIPDIKAKQT